MEFQTVWQSLKQEASQSSNYLGKELDGFLVADVQGVGDGSEDGSTRRTITIWMEDTRARVLTKALVQYPDQKARPEVELKRGRGRQGLLPDFKMEIPSPAGEPIQWYLRIGGLATKKKAVERRAAQLPAEYRTPLANLDTKYHGTQPGQVGPLVRRPQGYGQLLCLIMG